ncbi:hypothetical protein [Streptomyces sp. NPDC005438]|uniref:hypothetical protein n=1 Tax=Streptomyces sp. NPDC005438 TaxID=3156880 RepID=UPI0033AE931F
MLTTTVCASLTAAGLAIALLTAYRRRFVSATRIAAFALLPIGLAMTGLVTLGASLGRAIGRWLGDLLFSPTVWSGFAVLALSVVLFVVSRIAARRGAGRAGTSAPAATASGANRPAVAPASQAPARSSGGSAGGGGEDFSDIEAILKKHGI